MRVFSEHVPEFAIFGNLIKSGVIQKGSFCQSEPVSGIFPHATISDPPGIIPYFLNLDTFPQPPSSIPVTSSKTIISFFVILIVLIFHGTTNTTSTPNKRKKLF